MTVSEVEKSIRNRTERGHGSELGNEGHGIVIRLFDHSLVSAFFFGQRFVRVFFGGVSFGFFGFAVGRIYWRDISFSRKKAEDIWFRGCGRVWRAWCRFRARLERLE